MLKKCHKKKNWLNLFKCLFGGDRGELLGHVVSNKQTKMKDAKIKPILEAKAPKTVNKVGNFLGFVSFYKRLITKLVEPAAPIYALIKKVQSSTRAQIVSRQFSKP